jgi:hypothetical protein
MKISRSIVILAAIWAPLGCVVSAQVPASAKGFDAYSIVRTRNIFDPLRNPFSAVIAVARPRIIAQQPRRTVDFVTLTGIMVNNGKAFAFFSGSRPDYDKVMPANGDIAGAKLTKITPTSVEVNRGGKVIDIPVGQTMTFDSSTPGATLASPADAASFSAPAAAAVAPPPGTLPQTTTPLPGNLDDVMRRMMERRQQHLK